MRIVVTGASGNLGRAILARLAADGHDLVGVSRRAPEPTGVYAGVAWHEVDLSRDRAVRSLAPVLRDADAVVHLAWMLQPGHRERTMRRTNVDGARRVLEAVAATGVPHAIVVSSVGAYSPGPKDAAVDESWPTGGIHTSSYARHKAAVERLLDRVEDEHPELTVTRVRPALVFQRAAASEVARLFLGRIPPRLIGRLRLPIVPLPPRLWLQAIHADDLADGIARIVDRVPGGAFNLAADPVIAPRGVARLFGGRWLPVPASWLRALVALSWHLRLQPTAPGWLDLALEVPTMSTARAREELDWEPTVDARDAIIELLDGMADEAGEGASPSLRS
ncbi:NAD-dependent epimerase/dehydratase family protein [Pseudolysinimonas sp.]|uniref:NAD-dependent epimerase/dehydratase family protein n=1 Tax=Pseudolysinimonas sp. TaxID=2680009 RepID=UPI003F7DED6C